MNNLDRAVEMVLQGKANRQKDRADVLKHLEELIRECDTTIQLWQDYLSKPGSSPAEQGTILNWIGSDRAKQLHDGSLRAKASVGQICRSAGPEVGRFIGYDVDIVELAYRKLTPGETGPDAAKTAISRMQDRIAHIRGLQGRLRTAKGPSAKTSAKKSSGNKSAKSPVKKVTKKVAKKKVVKKKSTAVKTPKKKSRRSK